MRLQRKLLPVKWLLLSGAKSLGINIFPGRPGFLLQHVLTINSVHLLALPPMRLITRIHSQCLRRITELYLYLAV